MLLYAAALAMLSQPPQPAASPLSPVEQAQGFLPLSSENATTLWRGYKQDAFPTKGWTINSEGVISSTAGASAGDIITTDQFGDFELTLQYKTAPKANSGIIYGIAEKHGATWQTGPEFQVLDDAGHGLKPTDPHAAGALYDMYAPADTKVGPPADGWSTVRIYRRNGLLQHWLNGVKVVEARTADFNGKPTKEWLDKIAASKFKDYDGFGLQPRGHIGLQDHGDQVFFRHVKVRDLSKPQPNEKALFNGKDLTGWHAFVPDLAGKNPESVWSVQDGVLICKGNPVGYIRTTEKHTNYILRVEWRFNPETKKAGNSGVLLRMVGDDKVWPKSVEAQLQSGSAGDFWNIDNFTMTADPARTRGRNTKHTHAAERPIGPDGGWNEYEIIVNRGDVILNVNGEELNRATGVEEVPGYICLQSEGTEIHFRSVRLIPLD